MKRRTGSVGGLEEGSKLREKKTSREWQGFQSQ